MESEIDSEREKFSWGKNPERNIPRKGVIAITICHSNDATQPHIQEMHRLIQTYKIERKDQPLSVHGRHQTDYQKRKSIGNPSTDGEDIQSKHKGWNSA